MTLTRMWTLIGAVAVILIFAAGYAAGVAPALAAASSADEEIASVELQNAVKTKELAELEALSKNSDELFANLADVQRAIPGSHNSSVFANQISSLAAAAGVTVIKITYVSATDAVSPDEVAVPAAPAEGDEAAASEAETPAAEAEPATQSVPSVPGLIAMGVDIEVLGPYANVAAFMQSVQMADRTFSLSNVAVQLGSDETEWEMTLSGAIYVLLDSPSTIAFSAGSGNVS